MVYPILSYFFLMRSGVQWPLFGASRCMGVTDESTPGCILTAADTVLNSLHRHRTDIKGRRREIRNPGLSVQLYPNYLPSSGAQSRLRRCLHIRVLIG